MGCARKIKKDPARAFSDEEKGFFLALFWFRELFRHKISVIQAVDEWNQLFPEELTLETRVSSFWSRHARLLKEQKVKPPNSAELVAMALVVPQSLVPQHLLENHVGDDEVGEQIGEEEIVGDESGFQDTEDQGEEQMELNGKTSISISDKLQRVQFHCR